ncbi:MAG TPA: hypothetical protein PKM10_07270 [Halanaerobiales bacterium]|nr:hypothetical protein [Halanaerobiales bacterium]HQD04880.1 hypothetical protein [Halanaerobiales bacterium]
MPDNKISRRGLTNRRRILVLALCLLIILSILVLFRAIKNNIYWLSGFLFIIPLYFILARSYLHYRRMKNLFRLRQNWGQRVRRERNFNYIRLLFDKLQAEYTITTKESPYIDEETWQDLNLDEVFARLDNTQSTAGETVLYHMLRNPLFNKKDLLKRDRIIKEFQLNQEFRERLGLELQQLKRQYDNSLVELLWNELPAPSPFGLFLNLLVLPSIAIIISFFFLGGMALFFLSLALMINSAVNHFFKKRYFNKLPTHSIKYLSSLIKTADNIIKIENPVLEEYQAELRVLIPQVRKLRAKVSNIIPKSVKGELDFLYEYLNILFLIEIRNFNSVLRLLQEKQEVLQRVFILVGEIDALLAIASYRESLTYYCVPEFREEDDGLRVEDVYHPLLEDPVANSIEIKDRGLIITGSNMAGKSTFLRTIGVNTLLAQSIATCLATSYRGKMFKVFTSISRTDNILQGKSFYFAEAERLLEMLNAVRGEFPALCIVDELLSGTNSAERLAAAEGILDYLYENNVLAIVATHDLELAERLQASYDTYHFTDKVSKDGLDFDYKLKKGIAVSSNAIKLLEYLGYPEEITEAAIKRISLIDKK